MKKLLALTFSLLALSLLGAGGSLKVDPAKSVILQPEKKNAIADFSAKELQYHLQLITGKKIPIYSAKDPRGKKAKFVFHVGIKAPNDKKPLLKEEARWCALKNGKIYFYGDDIVRYNKKKVSIRRSLRGTNYAVYEFLNNALGVKHIEPGEKGIVYTKSKTIQVPIGTFSWRSPLEFRGQRGGIPSKYGELARYGLPKEFMPTKAEYEKWKKDISLWSIRQRYGARSGVHYGHAFVNYWRYYGKKHPEYFAMDNDGKRGPGKHKPHMVQLCMSNPAVVDLIVRNWAGNKSDCINLCPNDSTLFCLCPDCKKLGSKSDMMIYFMQEVAKRAKKIRKDVRFSTYAYLDYVAGPKKYMVPEGGVIGFVSIFLNLRKMEQYYKEWKKMGCKSIFLRPNTYWVDVGLPLGYEKDVYNEFMLGRKYGVIGTDVDSLTNTWSINGIAPYILSRSYIDPTKPFSYWEDDYCKAFGAAKEDVKKYYQFIRKNIWEERVSGKIPLEQMYDNLSYYVAPRIREIVDEKIYREAGKILNKIDLKKLTPDAGRRVRILKLENDHAILTARVIHASPAKKMTANKALFAFRLKHRNTFNIFWPNLFRTENTLDLTGMKAAASFGDFSYAQDISKKWFFDIDEKDVGVKEKWYTYTPDRIANTWSPFFVTRHWEGASTADGVPKALVKKLGKYDGIGWYGKRINLDPSLKGKKVFLHFGAVDESCTVYVNGKEVGKRLFVKHDDWKTPFDMEITPYINWKTRSANIVVRVQDKKGGGGIWKGVWIKAK